MNSSTKMIIGLAIIFGNAARRYLGFYPVLSLAGFGFNLINIGLYLFGFYLIDSAFRGGKNSSAEPAAGPAFKAETNGCGHRPPVRRQKFPDRNPAISNMKIKTVIFLITGVFLSAPAAWAHQPRLVGDIDTVEIAKPEISQAFYGELKGRPQVFKITADAPFSLYLGLLVPDQPESKTDFMVIAAKAGETGIDDIITLDGRTAGWTRHFEPFGGDYYLKGPEKKVVVLAGSYSVIVGNAENRGKYVLAVGEKETLPMAEIINTLKTLPVLKTDFFGQPVYTVLINLTGLFLLAVFFAIFITFSLFYRLARGRWPKVLLTLVFLISLGAGSLIAYRVIPALKANSGETASSTQAAKLESFSAVKPDLIATGRGLKNVEIWAVPTGTEITPDNYRLLGTAVLSETIDGEQTWRFPIPTESILATEIFAQGYNQTGLAIGKVSLPYTGASALYNELWGNENEGATVIQVRDNGRTFSFTLNSRFSLALDSQNYPPTGSVCTPAGVIEPVPDAVEPTGQLTTVSFQGSQVGMCELKNNDFSAKIKIYDPAIALVNNVNRGYSFSWQYPPEDIFSVQPDYPLATQNSVIRIDLPANYFSGTNLSAAGVIIGASSSPVIIAGCLEPGKDEKTTGTTTINGADFLIFRREEAAMGNLYETISYRTIFNGYCYEAAIVIHSGAIENFPPGAVAEFDREMIFNKLQPILESLVFIK